MINKRYLYLFIFFSLFSLASASISINQPNKNYNFGESFDVVVNLNPESTSGSFEINVVCGLNSVNVYKISPASSSFVVNQPQRVNHKIIFTQDYIGNLSGSCYISSQIANEKVNSDSFLLSENLILDVNKNSENYNPGEQVIISISAKKLNGNSFNGFIEFSGIYSNKKQINGNLEESFILSDSLAPGINNLNVLIYDVEGNQVLNKESKNISIQINQIPKSILLSLSNVEANPGEIFEFAVDVYDQVNNKMNEQVDLKVYDSQDRLFYSEIVSSGNNVKLDFKANTSSGNYKIIAKANELSSEKQIYLKPQPKLNFEFSTDSPVLIVKNIGNAPYNDYVAIQIGENNIENIPLSLAAGSEKRFSLKAPEGIYTVSAYGSDAEFKGELLLTGNAIKISEYRSSQIVATLSYFLWLVVILLLALGIVLFFRYGKTKNYLGKIRDFKISSSPKVDTKKNNYLDVSSPAVSSAESSLNIKGKKIYSSVVSIHIDNLQSMKSETLTNLKEMVSSSNNKQGVIDWKNDSLLVIFSPLLTKTYKNELIASKFAWKIKNALDEYNRRFNEKISYNIGINSGDMISSLENGKFNYTSLGNTVLLARKIANTNKGKLLVSQEFRQKLMRELKVEKIPNEEFTIFEITKVNDVEANQDKLRDLLKRTHFG